MRLRQIWVRVSLSVCLVGWLVGRQAVCAFVIANVITTQHSATPNGVCPIMQNWMIYLFRVSFEPHTFLSICQILSAMWAQKVKNSNWNLRLVSDAPTHCCVDAGYISMLFRRHRRQWINCSSRRQAPATRSNIQHRPFRMRTFFIM